MIIILLFVPPPKTITFFCTGTGSGFYNSPSIDYSKKSGYAFRCFAKQLNPSLSQMSYLCLSTVNVSDFYKQFYGTLDLDTKSGKIVMFKVLQERMDSYTKISRGFLSTKAMVLIIIASSITSNNRFT